MIITLYTEGLFKNYSDLFLEKVARIHDVKRFDYTHVVLFSVCDIG